MTRTLRVARFTCLSVLEVSSRDGFEGASFVTDNGGFQLLISEWAIRLLQHSPDGQGSDAIDHGGMGVLVSLQRKDTSRFAIDWAMGKGYDEQEIR